MTDNKNNTKKTPSTGTVDNTRRNLLRAGGAAGALLTTQISAAQAASRGPTRHPVFSNPASRASNALKARFKAAEKQFRKTPLTPQETNGDEALYDDYRASFTKTLVHNDLGEVDPVSYKSLLRALRLNRPALYERIQLDNTVRTRKLANPQAAYRFEMTGRDSHATRMRPAPAFESLETAAEMAEVYAKATVRDVPFSRFDRAGRIQRVADDLNAFSQTVGPKEYGLVTANTIFRGETPGDLVGPYISQFLLRDVPFGNATIVQRYKLPTLGVDFMTDYDNWLAVQRGGVPETLVKDGAYYIYNGRALGEFVHIDATYQAYLYAGLIMLSLGADSAGRSALASGLPYNSSQTQGGFVTFGAADILDLLAKGANVALTGAWFHKWLVHRRLRPETYAGRVHNQKIGAKDYGLPDEMIGSRLIRRLNRKNGTHLLPMAFAEGSPTHPSYPAGHATVAGCCTTILKAFFNEDYQLEDNVQANGDGTALRRVTGVLRAGDEMNKLAANIVLGRDWAGVHYRSDGIDGMNVGEQQAIGILEDYSLTYNERFDGFELTKFDGRRIRIKGGATRIIG